MAGESIRVTRSVVVPADEIELRFSRSSGPGGQHAQTSETRVEAVFDVEASAALTNAQKRRVIARAGPVLRAVAQDERSQWRNRELAVERLVAALREALRVLKPGGRFVFAGEPTTLGDKIARKLSHATWIATTKASHLPGLSSWGRPKDELRASSEAAALESQVDLHTFPPRELARLAVCAGAVDVDVATEELTAAWFGWPVRTVEAALRPDKLGYRWRFFAYKS